jgi:hypothetical protein
MTNVKYLLSLSAALLLVIACGGSSAGPGGGTSYDQYSLGWGRNLANPVRDAQLPDGVLFMITCINIDDEGLLEFGMPWQFYYAEPNDPDSLLIVMVQYIGTTNHFWEDSTSIPVAELPDYDDAGTWLDAARDSMGAAYEDWEEYALTVNANPYAQFPWVSNVAILQFMSADTTEQASVVLDADENQVLMIIDY